VTPYSWLRTYVLSAQTIGPAIAMPIATSTSTSRITSHAMLPESAPSAMRIPISRVRLDTV
jgi:hypothetical protein